MSQQRTALTPARTCSWSLILALICVVMFSEQGTAADVDQSTTRLAQHLLNQSGIPRGVCAVIGADGDLPLELARFSDLLLHVRDPNQEAVDGLRQKAAQAGYGIDRLVIENGGFERLPYVDNMIDVLIMTQADEDALSQLSVDEVLRVLRPEGIAIVGSERANTAALADWVGDSSVTDIVPYRDEHGSWIELRKPIPVGIDEWTHWEKSPDNNPVSNDQVIQAPYMTQFMSGPFYIGMPSITTAAGGRTFLAIGHIAHHRREWHLLNRIIARNGYNGTVLWERPLGEGYLVHRSAFIATPETFYMIDGDSCLMLEAASGKQQGRIRIPDLPGDWKWMAIQDDVLFVLAGKPEPKTETTKGDRTFGGWSWADLSKGYYGKRIPFGFGDMLAAYDLKQRKRMWMHREDTLMDSRGMSMTGGKTFLYCPDRHLRAIDSKTGEVLWTNADASVLSQIERPGSGLRSTPGFRTACISVATPAALVIQGQTRMNVVGISTADGSLLWQKKKITNNPNAIFVDGNVILGVGEGGSHVAIAPETGDVVEDLGFRKANCTRLTASRDSFFCRGEGTLRFDRASKEVLVDGGVRPGCNDGAIPAHGLLYIGPWQCDCNLSLIGQIAKCSAGDFDFDLVATEADRLTTYADPRTEIVTLSVSDNDWPTLRGNNARSSSTPVAVVTAAAHAWRSAPDKECTPTAPIAAGEFVFLAGSDGQVRALDRTTGESRWSHAIHFPIKQAPTVWNDRLYVGAGDGYVYCLEAATGRRLWRFRAAPVERHMMVYGALSSTWPVHTGVLVHDGVAYFAAGIIDQDGTYVYALNALDGSIKWQNNSSGHVNQVLRKGISAQGNLSIINGQLLLAGGNQISPARFDLQTGECAAKSLDHGRPKANSGQFVGAFQDVAVIHGGRILHSAPDNVSTKGSFAAHTDKSQFRVANGGIPPAWDTRRMALVHFRHGKLAVLDSAKVATRFREGFREDTRPRDDGKWMYGLSHALQQDGANVWQTDLGQPNKFEAISMAVCPNSVVAVVGHQVRFRAQPQWFVVALDAEDGRPIWKHELRGKPLPGGLLIDSQGHVVVTMLDGDVVGFGSDAQTAGS